MDRGEAEVAAGGRRAAHREPDQRLPAGVDVLRIRAGAGASQQRCQPPGAAAQDLQLLQPPQPAVVGHAQLFELPSHCLPRQQVRLALHQAVRGFRQRSLPRRQPRPQAASPPVRIPFAAPTPAGGGRAPRRPARRAPTRSADRPAPTRRWRDRGGGGRPWSSGGARMPGRRRAPPPASGAIAPAPGRGRCGRCSARRRGSRSAPPAPARAARRRRARRAAAPRVRLPAARSRARTGRTSARTTAAAGRGRCGRDGASAPAPACPSRRGRTSAGRRSGSRCRAPAPPRRRARRRP